MGHEQKVKILSPEEGYNKLAKEYQFYHEHLDSFEKGFFLRFLPRDLTGLDILDLGAGDGRMYQFFKEADLGSFVACDIAADLLKHHPANQGVEKVVCNLEKPLPFEDEEFDAVLSFFVLEHIKKIPPLFREVYRTLKPGGRFIIGHFHQRRAVEFNIDHLKFKIKRYNHRIHELEKMLGEELFEVHTQEILEHDELIGWIIVGKKN